MPTIYLIGRRPMRNRMYGVELFIMSLLFMFLLAALAVFELTSPRRSTSMDTIRHRTIETAQPAPVDNQPVE